MVFDENYYAKAARIFVGGSDEVCRSSHPTSARSAQQEWDVGSFVHPPLGKWTIALGSALMDPFGWRIGSAVAGTLAVTVSP